MVGDRHAYGSGASWPAILAEGWSAGYFLGVLGELFEKQRHPLAPLFTICSRRSSSDSLCAHDILAKFPTLRRRQPVEYQIGKVVRLAPSRSRAFLREM